MKELNLQQLRHFVTVVDNGSISEAASVLDVAAASLSVSLKHLERDIGVTLFIRRPGEGVTLTPEGVELLPHARQLLDQSREVLYALVHSVSGLTAPVMVGSLVTVAPLVLARLVARFAVSNREVDVEIRTGPQDVLINLLAVGAIHVAITYNIGIPERIRFDPLFTAAPWVMLPEQHRLAERTEIALADLAGEPMVALDLPISRDYFSSVLLSQGQSYSPRYLVNDLEMARSLVGNGLGWSLVNLKPPTSVASDGSGVRYVALSGGHSALTLGLAQLKSRRHPASVETFVAFARTALIDIHDEDNVIVEVDDECPSQHHQQDDFADENY